MGIINLFTYYNKTSMPGKCLENHPDIREYFKLKTYDMFGEIYSFQTRGKLKFQTTFGSLITMIYLFVIIMFGYTKLQEYNNGKPKINYWESQKDSHKSELQKDDIHLYFGFQFMKSPEDWIDFETMMSVFDVEVNVYNLKKRDWKKLEILPCPETEFAK